MRDLNVIEKIEESNRIEGIHRAPTMEELAEFNRFMRLPRITIDELSAFVKVYQPNATLRDKRGLDVRVASHVPPPGGPAVPHLLESILDGANKGKDPWAIHVEYETLHPFTDGNGRSGRMIWYWQMADRSMAALGFLHAFYYQTLRASQGLAKA